MPCGTPRLRYSKKKREMPEMKGEQMAHNLHFLRSRRFKDSCLCALLCAGRVVGDIRVRIHEAINYIIKNTQAFAPAGDTSALGVSAYGISLWHLGRCFGAHGRRWSPAR